MRVCVHIYIYIYEYIHACVKLFGIKTFPENITAQEIQNGYRTFLLLYCVCYCLSCGVISMQLSWDKHEMNFNEKSLGNLVKNIQRHGRYCWNAL
jgi:hypothetical protein